MGGVRFGRFGVQHFYSIQVPRFFSGISRAGGLTDRCHLSLHVRERDKGNEIVSRKIERFVMIIFFWYCQ
jgi:hypothetical protein